MLEPRHVLGWSHFPAGYRREKPRRGCPSAVQTTTPGIMFDEEKQSNNQINLSHLRDIQHY